MTGKVCSLAMVIGLELYDYPEVVRYPMDLGTINNKFKDKRYKTVEGVLNDIQLIWDNCKLYNSKNSVSFRFIQGYLRTC